MTWTLSTLNVNGLRSALDKGLHRWRARAKPDVLALQELKMQVGQMGREHQSPRGWREAHSDAVKKGYAGTAVWTRILPIEASRTVTGFPLADDEGRITRVDLPMATVASVYLPSSSARDPDKQREKQVRKDAFMAWFYDWAQALLDEGRPVVICGDLNIAHTRLDIHNPTANKKSPGFLPHEREWFSTLLEQGWVDVWRALHPDEQQYSWWSNMGQARAKNRGWRLDYQLASPDLAARAVSADIAGPRTYLSDHAPVTVTYDD